MAATCAAMDSRERRVNSSGSRSASAFQSATEMPIGRYASGSWALVWSVTMSIGTPRRNSSGKTSAALPTMPTDRAAPASFAATARAMASSRSV